MIIFALFCLGPSKYHTLSRTSIDVQTGGGGGILFFINILSYDNRMLNVKIENLLKMLLHLKHMSEIFTSLWILDNTAGYNKTHPIFTILFQLGASPKPKSGYI